MDEKKSPLKPKPATYTRGFVASHNTPVCLVGASRWLKDMELLMEDKWKNLKLAQDPKEVLAQAPKLAVFEAENKKPFDFSLVETLLPKSSLKLVVTSDTSDELGWKRTSRRLASNQISALVLSANPTEAATELSEVIEGLVQTSLLTTAEDYNLIKTAFQGYQILQKEGDGSQMTSVFRFLLSKFAFEYDDLNTGLLLAETYAQWKAPKEISSDIHLAYTRLEASLADKPILQLLDLSQKLLQTTEELSETRWTELLNASSLGRLTTRKLTTALPEVRQVLANKAKKTRHLRVA